MEKTETGLRLLGRLGAKAEKAELDLRLSPSAAAEVEREAAELMGIFRETAVGLDDIDCLEPGALDWLFREADEDASGQRG
ncbi:MAG: hypothetical protein LBE49_08360 [Deltaproteobacteria bacterium]|jgi:hypothetical protein|nr:hypothetical protein [Deltaproteobacteria bacterium]